MMASFTVRGEGCAYTLLPDAFVDRYMPEADGAYVKIYLYLLRNAREAEIRLQLSSVADVFSCSETDVMRALSYWEQQGLLRLDYEDGALSGLTLLPLPAEDALPSGFPASDGQAASIETARAITNDRRAQLTTQDSDARDVLMVAERYLARPLSRSDMNRLLYLYDELGLSLDLIDYLIEYCVSRNKRSIHYIEKVGLEWYNDGIRTVPDAKQRTTIWRREYYAILRAFGISGRNPIPTEVAHMERWLDVYGFSMPLVKEACARTIHAISQPSFEYTEGILAKWHKHHVLTLEDVEALDKKHSEERKQQSRVQNTKEAVQNRFNNFRQRDYDYEQLEQQMLNRQQRSPEDEA